MTLMTMTAQREPEKPLLFGFLTGLQSPLKACIHLPRPHLFTYKWERPRHAGMCWYNVTWCVFEIHYIYVAHSGFCYLTIKTLSSRSNAHGCTKWSFLAQSSLSATLKRNYMADIFGTAKDWVLQEPIWSKLNYFSFQLCFLFLLSPPVLHASTLLHSAVWICHYEI